MTGIHYVALSIPFCWKNRSDYVETHSQVSSFGSDAWAILSDIEQSIKAKVESIGMPLKEWDIEIFRGVLTGCDCSTLNVPPISLSNVPGISE